MIIQQITQSPRLLHQINQNTQNQDLVTPNGEDMKDNYKYVG